MDRILVDHRIIGGVPCAGGTQIPVVTILGLLGEGMLLSEVFAHYPQLVIDDILACPRYAAEALDQRTLPLRLP